MAATMLRNSPHQANTTTTTANATLTSPPPPRNGGGSSDAASVSSETPRSRKNPFDLRRLFKFPSPKVTLTTTTTRNATNCPPTTTNGTTPLLSSPMSMSTMTTSPVKLFDSYDANQQVPPQVPAPPSSSLLQQPNGDAVSPTSTTNSHANTAAHPSHNNTTNNTNAHQVAAALAFEKELPPVGTDAPTTTRASQPTTTSSQYAPPPTSTTTRTVVQNKSPPTNSSSSSSSWWTQNARFRDLCDKAFDMVDTDGSNSVDEKELYAGLLLIHLKLGMYVGPAACRPIGRERSDAVFTQFDVDGNGALNRHEFQSVMMVLFSNVLLRVLIQWSLTICLVPLVANQVLQGFYQTVEFLYVCLVNADEYSSIANTIELTVEAVGTWVWERTPGWMVVILAAVVDWWQAVPDSVWNAAPLALLSTLLGILVVPFVIFQVDDFFQYVAQRAQGTTTTAEIQPPSKKPSMADEHVSSSMASKTPMKSATKTTTMNDSMVHPPETPLLRSPGEASKSKIA